MLRSTLFVLFTLIAFSCHKDSTCGYLHCIDDVGAPKQSDEEYVTYFEALAQWKCLGISDYTMTYKVMTQACPDTKVNVTVVNNTIEQRDTEVGQFSSTFDCSTEVYIRYYTVLDIFQLIETAADTSIDMDFTIFDKGIINRADKIIVRYDKLLGYPKRIDIDYISGIADEELTIEVFDFQRND